MNPVSTGHRETLNNVPRCRIATWEDEDTPRDIAYNMLRLTAEDGILYVRLRGHYYDKLCRYRMKWNRRDCRNLCLDFDRLCVKLTAIGAQFSEFDFPNLHKLPPDLVSVWNTYVRPLENGWMDDTRQSILEFKRWTGRSLTSSDRRYLEKCAMAEEDDAYERLQDPETGPILCKRAHEFCRAVSVIPLSPEHGGIAYHWAENDLMQALALHRFGKKLWEENTEKHGEGTN